jgi:mannitol-1-phosphate 5-dehydrogenase
MRAVVVGAGKIGCGFLYPLLRDAGWEVVLGTRTRARAERIGAAGGFDVRVTGIGVERVDGIRTASVNDDSFASAVASADLIVTAVGVGNVAGLGVPLARALAARRPEAPVDVWVVENQDCAPLLEERVRRAASGLGLALPLVGFAGAVAEVAVGRGDWEALGRPEFCGDAARRLFVDSTRCVRTSVGLPDVQATDSYLARLHEKLFGFNAGHALAAYLGALRGHRTIDVASRDPLLRPLLAGCLLEARRALVQRYPILGGDVRGPVAETLARYGNVELADPIERVARDPIRKLRRDDRLVGSAALIRTTTGRVPPHFALGIAGALLYRNARDREASRLASLLEDRGVSAVIEEVCELDDGDPLFDAVVRRYRGFILTEQGALFPPVHEPTAATLVGG